jgi:hypothetical protein
MIGSPALWQTGAVAELCEHGVLDRVAAFLRSLPENKWHYRAE